MSKSALALILGFLSFFLFMFIGETLSEHFGAAGFIPTFVVMVAYFFVCQFFLSRGNPDAYRKDWPTMLALDAILLLAVFVMVLVEKREVVLTQGLGILLSCCGGTFAGAAAASLAARRRSGRR